MVSGDNSVVHTPYVMAMAIIVGIAIPVMGLGMAILIYNVWWLHRPLDGPMTQLIGVLLTGGIGGIASALFSRTTSTFMSSSVTGMGLGLGSPPGAALGKAPRPDSPDGEVA